MSGLAQFSDELDALVRRYTHEADLSYADVVGALEMKKFTLLKEVTERCADGEQADDAE